MAAKTQRKMTRRSFLRNGARWTLGAAFGALGWGHFVEAEWVEIAQIELVLPRLPRAFDGFRIAQISDIHIEGGAMRRHFSAVADLVSAQNADLLALTGDYITYLDTWQEEPLCAGFRRLRAREGVFAVMGNHDHWGHIEQPRRALRRANVRELRNEAHLIDRGGAHLWIAGVDDMGTRNGDIAALEASLPRGECAVLLAHEPDYSDDIATRRRFDLMLCGHSHGGQIALPFLGPIHLPEGAKKYPRGLYHVGEMKLYTNRGLGTLGPPLRFCAQPEITVFTLKAT